MPLRSPLVRLGWLFAAIFQLLLPTFASVADARAEAEAIRNVSGHVEAHGGANCPRVHPDDCVLCQVLAATAATAEPTAIHVPVARFIEAGPVDAERPLRIARAPGAPGQRAPPVQA